MSIEMQTHNWPYMHNMHVIDDLEDGEHLWSEGKEGWGLKLVANGFAMKSQSESMRVVGVLCSSATSQVKCRSLEKTCHRNRDKSKIENFRGASQPVARGLTFHIGTSPSIGGAQTGPTLQRVPIETHNLAPLSSRASIGNRIQTSYKDIHESSLIGCEFPVSIL